MKKLISILIGLSIALQVFSQEAKYVFYFIGDGMGVNVVNFTQYYKAAKAGQKGTLPVFFNTFPVSSVSTTWSASSTVTDSAASGTALATGTKTKNGVLGLDMEGNRLTSIAELSKQAGKKVGIVTTVGVNHATPGAFFAHQKSRNNYDQIVFDMTADAFDFYAGSSMLRSKKNGVEGLDYKKEFTEAGYTLVANVDECKSAASQAGKILFLPDKDHKVSKAIDRKEGGTYTTLADFVDCTIDFLMKDGCPQGFFIMAEGGQIDGCAHGNDAAAAVREIIDFEAAIELAYKFYLAHPDETAIIVTADHDTGGSAISAKNPTILDYQTASVGHITKDLKNMLKKNKKISWEQIKEFLGTNTGLFDKVELKADDEKVLRDIYDATIAKSATGHVTDEYGYNDNAVIVAKAVEILDKYAGIEWTTHSHSASYVPMCYIGPRPELFSVSMDNALITPKLIEVSIRK